MEGEGLAQRRVVVPGEVSVLVLEMLVVAVEVIVSVDMPLAVVSAYAIVIDRTASEQNDETSKALEAAWLTKAV